jgi:hypothetical protein
MELRGQHKCLVKQGLGWTSGVQEQSKTMPRCCGLEQGQDRLCLAWRGQLGEMGFWLWSSQI